jgi:hypothetical protein
MKSPVDLAPALLKVVAFPLAIVRKSPEKAGEKHAVSFAKSFRKP